MTPFSAWFHALREPSAPPAAIELAGSHVAGATLEWRGGRPVVTQHAIEPVPIGALVPALAASNVRDRRAVADALGRVLDRIGRPGRIALIVPDPVAKVSIVTFEQVPARAEDLAQLVRWQVRKTAPFAIEEAQVSHVPGARVEGGQEFVVTLARRDVVQEYEDLCAEAGSHAGIVDLATLNVVNAVLATDGPAPSTADWLLVNVAPEYASIAILRGADLIFFRNRSADGEGSLADLVHQSAMYYEDRLQGPGFARAVMAGAAAGGTAQTAEVEHARRMIEQRLGATVQAVDPRAAATLADRIVAGPALLDALAPLVGVLLRDRELAA